MIGKERLLRAPQPSSTAEYTYVYDTKYWGLDDGNKIMKWPGKALKQLFFLTPHLAQESKRARPKGKKSQPCAAPEIGPELSELDPAGRILVLAWIPFLCSDDGFKSFTGAH